MAPDVLEPKKMATEARRWPGKHTENDLRRNLIRWLGAGWHFQRHEDKISTGIADLSYASEQVDGWIELKVCKGGPPLKRLGSHQRSWLTRRGKAGSGRVFVFVWARDKTSDRLVVYHWLGLKKGTPLEVLRSDLGHNDFVARIKQMLRGV